MSSNLIICKQGDETACPVRLLKKYLQILTSSTPCLYAHFDGTGLTRYHFSSVLQKMLSFCEIQDNFRSHSFRIGGATEVKRLGVDDDTIKKWGRWCILKISSFRYVIFSSNTNFKFVTFRFPQNLAHRIVYRLLGKQRDFIEIWGTSPGFAKSRWLYFMVWKNGYEMGWI